MAKNQIQAESIGAIEKGKAAKDVALSIMAINKRLNEQEAGHGLERRNGQGRG